MNEMALNNGFTKETLEILKETINEDFDRFYGLNDPDFTFNDGSPNIFEKSDTGSGLDISKLECWDLNEYISERADDNDLIEAYWDMYDAESRSSQDEDENSRLHHIAHDKWDYFSHLLRGSLKNKVKYFKVFLNTDSEEHVEDITYIFIIE